MSVSPLANNLQLPPSSRLSLLNQPHIERALEALVSLIQVPDAQQESAQRSYKSVGSWLDRPGSRLKAFDPVVYIQGSFRLGTATRPATEDDEYDVDLVCELKMLKSSVSQAALKRALRYELQAYADAQSMEAPKDGRRCITLVYADSANFHLDALPALPDGSAQRIALNRAGLNASFSETSIAITDREDPNFDAIVENWPYSNPKGFSAWFQSRMQVVFSSRRAAIALNSRASVEDIPEYKVVTPLQASIQILKRHRDLSFAGEPENRPISIILTTLAAHAYEQQTTIGTALAAILSGMDVHIRSRGSVTWVENPSDPRENFADKWEDHPEREKAFYRWLADARRDFATIAETISTAQALDRLELRYGKTLIDKSRKQAGVSTNGVATFARRILPIVLSPRHKQSPPWSLADVQSANFKTVRFTRKGFRPTALVSDIEPVPKHGSLDFEVETDTPKPYKLFWQVINTGREAETAGQLRGEFNEGTISEGRLTRGESTLYRGRHSIECFIVKDGLLVARTGQFVVNIQ
jgi:hypothetical protein